MGTIGFFLFDGAEELDVVGPWEVLALWTQQWPDDGWTAVTFSREGGPVRSARGLVVSPEHAWADVGPLDVLVYPGGPGTRAQLRDEGLLAWVRGQRDAGAVMTSVCTGSLVYAAAGVLAGRPATSYWSVVDQLKQIDPSIEVRPDDRWVDSGEVVTAAGVSAGIDMALHLVRRLVGEERAKEVRRAIQYDPDPPV